VGKDRDTNWLNDVKPGIVMNLSTQALYDVTIGFVIRSPR
jgi:hypothetical protein